MRIIIILLIFTTFACDGTYMGAKDPTVIGSGIIIFIEPGYVTSVEGCVVTVNVQTMTFEAERDAETCDVMVGNIIDVSLMFEVDGYDLIWQDATF